MRLRKAIAVVPVAMGILAGAAQAQAQSYPSQSGQSPLGDIFSSQNIGTVLGGAGGALLGSQFGKGDGKLATVAVGTLLGAFLGREAAGMLDPRDQSFAGGAAQNAFETAPTGQTIEWRNPDSGHYGSVTPVRTYQAQGGQPCREFTQTINVGGRMEQATGTACRQADGTWKLVP